MPVTSYSRTPASNNSAPPNGWPEGQTPGSVNNCARQLMTDIVNEASKSTAKVLSSVAGTNTITAAMSPTLDAYSAGMILVFTPANTNTGATTININTLGALDIQKQGGGALVAGDLVVGIPALIVLDAGADDFALINPQVAAQTLSGTYTPTFTNQTNVSASVAAFPWQYMRIGNVVTVAGTVTVTCTSGIGVATELRATLPIASVFLDGANMGGAGAHNSSAVGIQGNVASAVAAFTWFSSTASAIALKFSFTYIVL